MEMEMMTGDEAIVKRMREILEAADLSVITTKDVRMQLEKDLGVDMSDKKAFIREQVDLFMDSRASQEEAEKEGVDAAENGGGEPDGSEPEEEEEETPDTKQARITRAMKESLPKTTNKRKRGVSGFQKVCQLSPELAAVIGESQFPRTQVVRLLWKYIREHDLQVPKDRRKIRCDEALKKIFNVDQVDMFKMQKKLSKHLFPLDEESYLNAPERSKVNDAKPELGVEDVTRDKGGRAAKRIKRNERKAERERADKKLAQNIEKRRRGFAAPVRISTQLQEFLQVQESELSRQEVTKRMWEYIKGNNLQDPDDRRIILCDDKLNRLFNCEKFSGFGDLPKLLKPHYLAKLAEKDEEAEEKVEEGSGEEEDVEEANDKDEEHVGKAKQDQDTEMGETEPEAEGISKTEDQDTEMAEIEQVKVEGTFKSEHEEEKESQDTEMAETEPKKVERAFKAEDEEKEKLAETEAKNVEGASKTEDRETELAETTPEKVDGPSKTEDKEAETEPKKVEVASKTETTAEVGN